MYVTTSFKYLKYNKAFKILKYLKYNKAHNTNSYVVSALVYVFNNIKLFDKT